VLGLSVGRARRIAHFAHAVALGDAPLPSESFHRFDFRSRKGPIAADFAAVDLTTNNATVYQFGLGAAPTADAQRHAPARQLGHRSGSGLLRDRARPSLKMRYDLGLSPELGATFASLGDLAGMRPSLSPSERFDGRA
jgi:hypothetical protein